jgi:hypothetical protein
MAFKVFNTHDQWIKLFWNKTGLDLVRTKNALTILRKNQVIESNRGDHPPNVWLLDEKLEQLAFDYIKSNQESLLKQTKALPLNRMNLREDTMYAVLIMKYKMKREEMLGLDKITEILVPCQAGDLENPNNALYIVLYNNIHTSSGIKIGYCKPITLEGQVRELINDISIFKYEAKHAIIQDDYNMCKHGLYQFNLGKSLKEDDEYLNTLFCKALNKSKYLKPNP